MMRITGVGRWTAPLAFWLVIGCGGDAPTAPGTEKPGPPAQLTVAGGGQTGAAGAALTSPIVVTVKDAGGRPVPGVSVTFTTSGGSFSPASGVTNSSGLAQATWTLAPKLGPQAATVAVGTLQQTVAAEAQMPSTTTLLQVSTAPQADTVGAVLADTLVVQVRLPSGAGLPDVELSWSAGSEGGSVAPLAARTDAQGRARAVWTLGTTAGENRVTVTGAGLNTVTFATTVLAGAPHEIVITPDSLLLDKWADTASLAASIRDRYGNPAAGAPTWQSADTMIARVSGSGRVTSHAAGRAMVMATVGSVSAERPVRVAVQRNVACTIPTHTPRGAAAGIPAFGGASILTQLPEPAWPGLRSLPLDYDGDGDQDIVRLEYSFPDTDPYSGTTRVFRNDGGALVDATAQVLASSVVPDHPRDFEIADFTGDGVADLYVAQHGFDAAPFPGAPNLFFTRQGAQLAQTAQNRFSPSSTSGFTHASASADVDCDGDRTSSS